MKTLIEKNIGALAGFVFGAVTAVCVFGTAFVFGTGAFWDYPPTDFSSHLIGYRMYLLDAWRFPLFFTATLEEPRGLNLLYMDGLPLVALFAKALTPLVPGFLKSVWFNPFGVWCVVSYGLQGAFGARLMRELAGASLVAELSGAVLAVATPVFVLRFIHIALASHFFILAALLLYVQSVRGLAAKSLVVRWALLFAGVTLVHPYLFAMCAVLFGATLATLAVRARVRDAALAGAVSIAVVLAIVVLAGFHGAEVTRGGMWGYGYKTTDLVSFFVPQWATFFPVVHAYRIDVTRAEAAEGWAYLGTGVLVAFAIVCVSAPRALGRAARTHGILAAALVAMALFAISHRVTAGMEVLFELPLPSVFDWPTRQFRSCGRFIWPALYAGSFYAFALLHRLTRTSRFRPLVPMLATVQLLDVLAAFAFVRDYTSRGEARFLEWERLAPVVADHRSVSFEPGFECIPWTRPVIAYAQLEVEFMAASRGVGLSSVRSSRPMHDCRIDPVVAARAPVEADRLYLLFRLDAPPAEAVHFERAGAPCASFQRVTACSRRFASGLPDGARPFSPDVGYALGQTITFGDASNQRYLGVGWSWPEGNHRWTDGESAFVYLRSEQPVPQGARVRVRAAGIAVPGQPISSGAIWVNGALAGEMTLASEASSFEFSMPASAIGESLVEIELRPSHARRVTSSDPRVLGIAAVDLSIVP